MKAVVKQKPEMYKAWQKGLALVETEIPDVQKTNDVQIRVVAGGICGTDVGIYGSKDSLKTTMSKLTAQHVTIGHEFCGRITAAGPRAKLVLARRLLLKAKEFREIGKFTKQRSAAQVARDTSFIEYLNEHFIST
ncbi:MAG TPA: alcohol dehydrogenase catalytic domain-containing protein, partial [Bacteroidota bacterium]|nr:alcohol dehydrogenase catalytic domain-containing protein [Bacteroidota bacterium]